MLHHNPAAIPHGLVHRISQNRRLGKSKLKTHVHMIGVMLKITCFSMMQQGKWACVDALIIIGKFQTREHPLDQQGFSCPGITDHTNEQVLRGQIAVGEVSS